MGFILDGLETEAYDRQYSDRELVARIASYFRPHARQMALVALAITLNSVTGSAGPILISKAIDLLSRSTSTQGILLAAAGILLLGVFGWAYN